jgi:hypothetical protein
MKRLPDGTVDEYKARKRFEQKLDCIIISRLHLQYAWIADLQSPLLIEATWARI